MKTAIGSYEIRLYICMLIIDEGKTEDILLSDP